MFVTNFALKGDHIGSFSYCKKLIGKQFEYGQQPFKEYDCHLIYGPEDDISKLISNQRFKELIKLNK